MPDLLDSASNLAPCCFGGNFLPGISLVDSRAPGVFIRGGPPRSARLGLSGAVGAASPGVGTFFEHIDAVVCPSAPLGPSGDRKPDPRAINCGRLQTKAAFRSDAVGLSCHWRRFAGRRGSGVAGRRPNHRRELRGPRGHHLRRDARSTSAQGLRPPPMASP
jgi:hypothetical protein